MYEVEYNTDDTLPSRDTDPLRVTISPFGICATTVIWNSVTLGLSESMNIWAPYWRPSAGAGNPGTELKLALIPLLGPAMSFAADVHFPWLPAINSLPGLPAPAAGLQCCAQ